MNNIVRKRLSETIAIAAVFATLITAISIGVLFINAQETDKLSKELQLMAEKTLTAKRNQLISKEVPIRGFGPIRRAFQYRNENGKIVGAGFSIRIDIYNARMGIFVVTDDKGRIRSSRVWPGVSGIRAEELRIYMTQREKGSKGGLAPFSDINSLEFSVTTAFDETARIVRSWEGSKK